MYTERGGSIMAETFRATKLEKFIQKQVEYMEHQQRTIEAMRKEYGTLKADELLTPVLLNQNAFYNYTFDLCREFSIEMPHVKGVTKTVIQ